ncbi:hypothetical protein ACFOWE_18300 [Planomonospora corallina]|uniref:Uncharacterized protein n=1 Tax=Planomonospora corallina TaxID=1806052 RepID=A0ABV8I8Q3_9ACTN
MLTDYLELGGVEIANHARLRAYLGTVGSPLASGDICGCPTFTAGLVGDAPYTTPEQDQAPWWDPNVPESAGFAGLLVLDVEGMPDHPVRRTVTGAAAGGAALGPARVQARTITVTGILLGATCCAVEYGQHWLAAALDGCAGGGCSGDALTVFTCCPDAAMTPQEFTARHRRTLRRVALVDGPRELARAGDGCTSGECSTGADIITVEFVLSAATPWLWTDPVPVLDVDAPTDSGGCVTWCVHPPSGGQPPGCADGCRLAACTDPASACADPSCRPAAPPVPAPPETCFCQALAVNADCYDLDLSARPNWAAAAPLITVAAGSSDLRRLTITFYERRPGVHDGLTADQVADAERCTPHSVYHVGYVPAGGIATLDGQIGRALVECGGVSESSPDVWGRDGGPPAWRPLDCHRDQYVVCVEADAVFMPAQDATVSIAVTGRGY